MRADVLTRGFLGGLETGDADLGLGEEGRGKLDQLWGERANEAGDEAGESRLEGLVHGGQPGGGRGGGGGEGRGVRGEGGEGGVVEVGEWGGCCVGWE